MAIVESQTGSAIEADCVSDTAEVLAITFEREAASGDRWCLPHDAAIVQRWITGQGRELGGAIRQLVRLVRVMARADGGDYSRFLYQRLRLLRPIHFASALRNCARAGLLAPPELVVSARGIIIADGAVARRGERTTSFEVAFSQMPRLCALLDVAHNALGFANIAAILEPIESGRVAAAHCETAARQIEKALLSWLAERLESRHHLHQARTLRRFLAHVGRVEPEAVTDETILRFWLMQTDPIDDHRVDGFRQFTSAARGMLAYRQALLDARIEAQLEDYRELGLDQAIDPEGGAAPAAWDSGSAWVSPLAFLLAPPAAHLKWLTGTERATLRNYLGGYRPGDEPEAPIEACDAMDSPDSAESWATGLAGDQRFDLRFVRTLLRATVFGTAQTSIIARLQKRHPDGVGHVLRAIDDGAYLNASAAFARIDAQIREESLAALHVLARAGALEAVLLVAALSGAEVVASLRQMGGLAAIGSPRAAADRDGAASGIDEAHGADAFAWATGLSRALMTAAERPGRLQPGPLQDLLFRARTAAQQVKRQGFPSRSGPDTTDLPAFRAAAPALSDLAAEMKRLVAVLGDSARESEAREDKARFAAGFANLYGGPARNTRTLP